MHIKLSSLPSFLDFKGLAILLFNSNVYSLKASTLSEERGFPQAIDAISNFEARASGSSSGVVGGGVGTGVNAKKLFHGIMLIFLTKLKQIG